MTPEDRTWVLMKLHRIGALSTRSKRLKAPWTPEQDLEEIATLYAELTSAGAPLDPYSGHARECKIRGRGVCDCV